jgi:hypothetical protein
MKNVKTKKIEHYTSYKFQAIHETGAADRTQEMDIIKNLHMTDYSLRDIKATMTHNVIVVTYWAKVTRIINGSSRTTDSPRLSSFVKIDGKWKWVAHANLSQVPQ